MRGSAVLDDRGWAIGSELATYKLTSSPYCTGFEHSQWSFLAVAAGARFACNGNWFTSVNAILKSD
jgi:hypothetical protein